MEHATEKPWISADLTIDGVTFPNVGVKTKGNSSLSQVASTDSERFGLKVNLGKYEDNQTCYGLDKLNINNVYGDYTYMKEYMSFLLMNYMDAPCSLYTFARISVNGEYYGFCFILKDTDDSFLYRIYGEGHSVEAYKPESMGMTADPTDEGETNEGFPMPGCFPDMGEMRQPGNMPQMPDNFPDGMPQIPDGFPGGLPQMPQMHGGLEQEDSAFSTYEQYQVGIESLKIFGALRSMSVLGPLHGTIPSTQEEQTGSKSLIDASALNLSSLGSLGMGGGGGMPGPGGMPRMPGMPATFD